MDSISKVSIMYCVVFYLCFILHRTLIKFENNIMNFVLKEFESRRPNIIK